jgi:hypothetical protein
MPELFINGLPVITSRPPVPRMHTPKPETNKK